MGYFICLGRGFRDNLLAGFPKGDCVILTTKVTHYLDHAIESNNAFLNSSPPPRIVNSTPPKIVKTALLKAAVVPRSDLGTLQMLSRSL